MSSTTSFWRSSGMSRIPNAMFAVLRSGETTPCEKYGGTESRSWRTFPGRAAPPELKMSGSDSAGHSSGAPFVSVQRLPLL